MRLPKADAKVCRKQVVRSAGIVNYTGTFVIPWVRYDEVASEQGGTERSGGYTEGA